MVQFKFVRLYSDELGDSHFDEQRLAMTLADFAPPAPPLAVSARFGLTLVGSVKANVDPFVGSLWTHIRPPCISTNFFVRASPSPVPSGLFCSFVATWRNSSKIRL